MKSKVETIWDNPQAKKTWTDGTTQKEEKSLKKIAKEIKNPFVLKAYALSGRLEDRIAEEVMHKMRKGDLITHPNDKRRYTETPKKDTRTPSQRLDDEIREKYKRMKN